ncbi:uncharacterized protein B0I36DRAFT_313340 [Microdochium trichocladiopsis]|uniref:Uncharacterized protein n=1 Tax=Microdochium trichocladiopsis TaxID=1682393 RepID=A0A9P9BTM7_9PEZI|nr:uncharacterized protein B0I36DRAFT_313340 [Microdochium trichocladiopsis]KAH7037107.1 hypothetical protein B0I36DRAFT_313340 [Microdochium trichocladiopsis]
MPLFGSRKEAPPPEPIPEKHHSGLFGSRRRSVSPVSSHRTSSSTFRTSTSSNRHSGDLASSHRSSGSVLHRFGTRHGDIDPSISQARDRVINAERAEKEADRALEAARLQVRDARTHVKNLEHEAAEESRRAKVKQYHAKEMSKRGKHLGRHGL